jgi:hypothetical protein
MKRYRLDPKNPRRLTAKEKERLEAAPIDYSDIPPLGEGFFLHHEGRFHQDHFREASRTL